MIKAIFSSKMLCAALFLKDLRAGSAIEIPKALGNQGVDPFEIERGNGLLLVDCECNQRLGVAEYGNVGFNSDVFDR